MSALRTVEECEIQRVRPYGRVFGKWFCPRCYDFSIEWMIRPMTLGRHFFSLDRKRWRTVVAEAVTMHMNEHRSS